MMSVVKIWTAGRKAQTCEQAVRRRWWGFGVPEQCGAVARNLIVAGFPYWVCDEHLEPSNPRWRVYRLVELP